MQMLSLKSKIYTAELILYGLVGFVSFLNSLPKRSEVLIVSLLSEDTTDKPFIFVVKDFDFLEMIKGCEAKFESLAFILLNSNWLSGLALPKTEYLTF